MDQRFKLGAQFCPRSSIQSKHIDAIDTLIRSGKQLYDSSQVAPHADNRVARCLSKGTSTQCRSNDKRAREAQNRLA